MKIALCLYGYIGKMKKSMYGDTNKVMLIDEGYSHIKENVIGNYDVSTFIHSFDLQRKEEILSTYTPTDSIIESQKQDFLIDHTKYLGNCASHNYSKQSLVFNLQSAKYSRKQSILLKDEFEKNNNLKFDWVFVGRFDMAYMYPFNYNELNNNKIYVAGTTDNSLNRGKIHDVYFLGNSDNINKIANFYDDMYQCGLNEKNFMENIHDIEAIYFKKNNLWNLLECMYDSPGNWSGEIRNLRHKPDVKWKIL